MLCKTQAIVLKSIKYGESGLVAQVYTEDFGRQSFLIHSVRKRRSKFHYALFEPLSLLDLDIYYKENRDLHSLKEAKLSITFHHIPFDIKKSTIAIFISEVLYRSLREVESNKPLFNFLFHAIQILDMAEEGIEYFHLIFLIQLSKFLGIYPKNNAELIDIKPLKASQLRNIFDYSLQDIGRIKMEHTLRNDLLNNLINYYQDHLEGMGEIKSLQVLREVYI